MEDKGKATLFHIYRKDGSALFLHPFQNSDKFLELLQKDDFEGKYGAEPRVEALTLFRNDLYRLIEEGVKNWVADKKFIPRFILSAAVFLFAYLFFSLIVRDPLPMLDELLIAGAAAVAVYFIKFKKDQKSQMALKMRVALRTKVDRIIFTEDPFVKRLEECLHRDEGERVETVLRSILPEEACIVTNKDQQYARELLSYMEKRFSGKDYRRQEKRINRLKKAADSGEIEDLARWAETKKVDFSLFALYTKIKEGCEKVK